jgi:hypothetical protein
MARRQELKNKIILLSLFMRKNKYKDDILAERPVLQAVVVMELLRVQVDDKFFQQKYGMAMGSSLSAIASDKYNEHFEKLALESAQSKPPV